MLYVTGIFALNLPCNLDTSGDWHTSALNWENVELIESEKMHFKNYGIEENKHIPEHTGEFYVANHIRASLDLLEMGKLSIVQGMNKDFISNDKYNDEIFTKVYSMKELNNWNQIDEFMKKEYMMKWIRFKENRKAGVVA
jgi:hypothetical protein